MLFSKNIQEDFKFKIWTGVCYLTGLLLLFTLIRLGIFATYYPVFSSLNTSEIVVGFLRGIQFDASIICLFAGPLLFAWFLPIRSVRYLKAIYVCWVLLFLFFVFVLAADFVYFPEAKRHMAEELLYIKNEIPFLVRYALQGFWWVLLLMSVGFWAAVWGGVRIIEHFYKPVLKPLWQVVLLIVCVMALLLLGMRGHIGRGKPLSTRSLNALSSGIPQGVLMSNGVFSAYHALRRSHGRLENSMPQEEALAHTRQLLASKEEIFLDDAYPLMRAVQKKSSRGDNPKNVFVVLLESWTPRYIDAYGGGNYAVTPHFDKMVRSGVQFTNAYAVGVRSIFGLTAAFTGVPLVPGLVQFSDGLEMNNITSLARALRDRGYYTAFMQSSLRSSYQMCNMATHIFGFEESYGMEDFPKLMNYQAEQDFGYDHDLLQFAADKAAQAVQAQKPFLIFTFTGTTHTPFKITTPQFEKYPRTTEENKYLNTLYYADYAIGQLLARAEQEGWLNDTIFVFMADHTLGLAQKENEIHHKFRIPYVIYAPSMLPAQKIDYPVSQLDLIPTLFHLLDLSDPFSALGVDSLNARITHRAFITEGDIIALITPQGFIRHNREKGQESSAEKDTPVYKQMEQDVLALDKSVTSLLQSNRWMRGAK